MKEELTYEKAMCRLEEIVQQIEDKKMSIDSLESTINEAKKLMTFCSDKLTKVEKNVNDILGEESSRTSDETDLPF